MRYLQLLARTGVLLWVGLVLAACEAGSQTSRPPDGLPIDPGVVDVESVGGLCVLRGDLRPLVGIVRVDLNDPELVWVERPDGTRASVSWPMGFWLDRETPAVRDGRDAIVAQDGVSISFDTLDWRVQGTPSQPYVLVGDINGRCYG